MVETGFAEFLPSGWKESAKSAYHDGAAGRVSQVPFRLSETFRPSRARSTNQ
jgi:hypothetical protein